MKINSVKKGFLLAFLVFPIFVFSQSNYTIKGYGKGFKDGEKIFLLYRELGKQVSTADSTFVKDGVFSFKGSIKNVVTGGIYRNTNPVYANEIADAFTFYVEPGHITMQSIDTLRNMVVTGTSLNDDYMKLVLALKPLTDQTQRILKQLSFVKENPTSYVSLVTLNSLSKDAKLLAQVEEVYPFLSAELKAKPFAEDILRRVEFAKKIKLGMVAKEFSQMDSKGNLVKLSDYRGKFVLVDFWASWCLPCRDENPNVSAAYKKYKDRGFTVLGVSLDDKNGKSAWLKAIKDDALIWAQVSDLKGWKNEVAILYGITAIPANVLIDPNGKIIAKDLKGIFLTKKLSEIFGVN